MASMAAPTRTRAPIPMLVRSAAAIGVSPVVVGAAGTVVSSVTSEVTGLMPETQVTWGTVLVTTSVTAVPVGLGVVTVQGQSRFMLMKLF